MEINKISLTRRKFIVLGGLAFLLAAGWTEKRAIKGLISERMYPSLHHGTHDETPFDERTANTLLDFIGILFDHHLTDLDKQDLQSRISLLVTDDAAWRPKLHWFADYLDNHAKARGMKSFVDARLGTKRDIVSDIAKLQIDTERSRLLNLVSESERQLHFMRGWTIHYLATIYRNSGAPWRNRGYTSWPGVPGDMLEYTQPGNA
jgi:hypothetical protein